MSEPREPFFIGWAAPPKPLREFLVWIAALLIGLFAALGWLLAATQNDPGDGAGAGRQTVWGVVEANPYPILHVTKGKRFAKGDTILLSGIGKRGVQKRAEPVNGQAVRVVGAALRRGEIDMLQVFGGKMAWTTPDDAPRMDLPQPVPLGRWRLTGEICDGKCYVGAMRPGEGLAHKACANLCLIGGAPPVFVSTDRVDGEQFLLMGDADGGPVTDAILDHVAAMVTIDGDVERRGTLLVFKIDPGTIRRAQ